MKAFKNKIFESGLVKNGIWGIGANILQSLFVSVFFIIIARKYSVTEFANFLIALTVYQLLVAFSSLGLGQWFIREFNKVEDKATFTAKFFKTQLALGIIFYIINILLSFAIYEDAQIRLLCIILASNIIFDNLVYALKSLNIAQFEQKKTFIILTIDGLLRLILSCILLIYPFSIIILSVSLISIRFLTTNLFIRLGSSDNFSLSKILQVTIGWDDAKTQIFQNWQFVIIGSMSIVYWRMANIIISKMLTLEDVANYEIAYKLFSLGMMLPVVAAATIYSQFSKLFYEGEIKKLKNIYEKLSIFFTLFSVMIYIFVFSFADLVIPFAFGDNYSGAISCARQMFLTALLFPTVILQANLIVAMKEERTDMWLNILSLIANVAGCFVGFYYVKSIEVINYSILISFLIFHISQNLFLVNKGIKNIKECILFYTSIVVLVVCYDFAENEFHTYFTYIVFTVLSIFLGIFMLFRSYKSNGSRVIKLKNI